MFNVSHTVLINSKKGLFKHYVILDAVNSHGMCYLLVVLIYRQYMTRTRLLRFHCLSAPDKDRGFEWRSLLNTTVTKYTTFTLTT